MSQNILPVNILAALNKTILSNYPRLKQAVFDPNLGYITSVYNNRMANLYQEASEIRKDISQLPMLAWSRTAVKPLNRPFQVSEGNKDTGFTTLDATIVEFEYQFVIFTTNTEDLELIELDWALRKGLRKVRTIVINTELGPFEYGVVWSDELNDLSFSVDVNYYKSLSGSCKISGPLIYMGKSSENLTNSIIESVEFNINDCRNSSDLINSVITKGKLK